MKHQHYSLLLITGLVITSNLCFGQANKTLSNLNSPTAVNQDLLPDIDNSKNLGSSLKSWKDFYLDGYLYLDGFRWLANPGSDNTMVGKGAGANTSGADNTFIGKEAGVSNTTGYSNAFIGEDAGWNNTTGYENVFIGTNSGYFNTTSYGNTAVGHEALLNNTANSNTGVGYRALYSNTDGYSNSAFGDHALSSNTSGYTNAAFGDFALTANTTGNYNSAFGYFSLYFNSIGSNNSAFGKEALFNNTGSFNTACGSGAGDVQTTASNNSFFGYSAGGANTFGFDNTVMGASSGFHLTTGDENTFVGQNAGYTLSTGSNVTCIGDFARVGSGALNNASAFGSDAIVSSSNTVRVGSSSVTSIGGYAGWTNLSDGRFKKNIREDVAGLEFISKLRPVTYTLDIVGVNNFFGSDEETSLSEHKQQAITEKERIVYTGFIAQEVEAAAKEIGYDFSGVDAPKNENDLYGLRYAEFVVPLVKAVQEQNELINNLQKQIDELKGQIPNSSSEIELSGKKSTYSVTLEGAWLEQNIPNPFNGSTVIRCFIPETFSSAQLIIISANGNTLKRADLTRSGLQEITIHANEISAGTYSYSLYIDGKVTDTKQMVITR